MYRSIAELQFLGCYWTSQHSSAIRFISALSMRHACILEHLNNLIAP